MLYRPSSFPSSDTSLSPRASDVVINSVLTISFFFLRTLCTPLSVLFFFNDTATTEIYTLSLHDALPIFYLAGYDGKANYHSGQFKVQRPFSKGFTMLLGYTWSRAIDDTGGTFVGEADRGGARSEEHTSELQSHLNLVCRLLLEKKTKQQTPIPSSTGRPRLRRPPDRTRCALPRSQHVRTRA